MIKATGTQIWTARGWKNIDGVFVGDKTISYNPQRNCTEYDEVSNIILDYKSSHLLGYRFKSVSIYTTKDHPLILVNNKTDEIYRKPIDDLFLSRILGNKRIIYNRWFEPYRITQDTEDVLWSARMASTFLRTKELMPEEYKDQIWNIIYDLNGIQAQQWIEQFYSWSRQVPSAIWMHSTLLHNRQVRDMLFHVGPKAGLGVQVHSGFGKNSTKKFISVSNTADINIYSLKNWKQERHVGHIFNVTTRNGNFLARSNSGTYIIACNAKEES